MDRSVKIAFIAARYGADLFKENVKKYLHLIRLIQALFTSNVRNAIEVFVPDVLLYCNPALAI